MARSQQPSIWLRLLRSGLDFSSTIARQKIEQQGANPSCLIVTREIAGDVEDEVGGAMGVGVDQAVVGRNDRHVDSSGRKALLPRKKLIEQTRNCSIRVSFADHL